jgi:hypothetical protein
MYQAGIIHPHKAVGCTERPSSSGEALLMGVLVMDIPTLTEGMVGTGKLQWSGKWEHL